MLLATLRLASRVRCHLDDQKGGSFRIASLHEAHHKQMYLPDSNVLVTRFLSEQGVGEVVDFMPIGEDSNGRKTHQIVRVVRAVRGAVPFRLQCRPAFDFARRPHQVVMDGRGAVFESAGMKLSLISRFPLAAVGDGVAVDFVLEPGESSAFILRQCEHGVDNDLLEARLAGEELLARTVKFWRKWLAGCQYTGRWREMVYRSALALKLMAFEPTGAIVAAPTCSLPEEIGGVRNWDYRFTWIRDAAFTLSAFLRLGFTQEADRFMGWLEQRAIEGSRSGPLQVMYRIDGGQQIDESNLDHLDGYRGSRPVRIGNAAHGQLQLDIYGELMSAVDRYDQRAAPISYGMWTQLRRMLDWVADHWHQPDDGIWEVRGGAQQFVYSKVQCWIAIDRALRMAHRRTLPLEVERLRGVADEIYETVMAKGYDHQRQTFVQYFGTDALDAANLVMPAAGFLAPTDPRMLGTLERTMNELVSDSLVYRYEVGKGAGDGLTGEEGTFNMCTFWLVDALTRAGYREHARLIFEKMLTYANHLGLYSEQIGAKGEALGNFPQALTHIGLVRAALTLDRRLGEGV